MSRSCIITSTNRRGSCSATSTMVHCRNALELNKLGIDLVEGEEDAHKLENPYDNIICSYASYYMPWKAYFERVMESKAKLWWLINDHDVEDNILLRNVLKATDCKRTYGVISNNTREGFRQWILRKWIVKDKIRLSDCIHEWHTVNLNALTFKDHTESISTDLLHEEFPAIYWGSWRKWRLPYFLKYSHPDVFFSTSAKNRAKLQAAGCQYKFVNPIKWGSNGTLLNSHATVYIEDPHTHENYAYPANRFYEAISYNVNIPIDITCKPNAERFGYKDLQYINSVEELLDIADNWQPNPVSWLFQAEQDKQQAISDILEVLA